MAIIEMKVPELAESITEVTLAQFLISDGDVVEMDQPICEMETDKASQELAEKAGKVTFVAEEGSGLSRRSAYLHNRHKRCPSTQSRGSCSELQKQNSKKKQAPVVEAKKEESYAKGHASPAASKMITKTTLMRQVSKEADLVEELPKPMS